MRTLLVRNSSFAALLAGCVLLLARCNCGPAAGGEGADVGPRQHLDAGDAGDDLIIPRPDAAQPGLDAAMAPRPDAAGVGADVGPCPPPQTRVDCPAPVADGCGGAELCGADGTGNGLDDNCNGQVDEGCPCSPGKVHGCFGGPPGKRGHGACTDGTQTCTGSEIGSWGPCLGYIGPSAETCDKLDNDCNGCADDGLCCGESISCPAQGDPRIASVQPFTDLALKGELFFAGTNATGWKWTVTGGPCDQLFATTTSPVTQSFTLTSPDSRDATVHFTLSGDYTVTMTVTTSDGKSYTCTWVQHVIGPGVRVELCWDKTGDSGSDLDLHLHRSGTTTAWFGSDTNPNTDDCNFSNCTADTFGTNPYHASPTAWGYTNSPIAACSGTPLGGTWQSAVGACHNPRLDIDNIDDVGKPENINVDAPKNGESFRAMVHYYDCNSYTCVDEHPIVNIYCGGTLLATFGKAPDTLSGFNDGQRWGAGLMWRVADIKANVDGSGTTTGCNITMLHPAGTTSGYWVTNDDTSY